MYSIFSTSQFKKDLKKAQKSGLDNKELKSVINCLARGEELDVKYRDHLLTGNYKGYRECHIRPDWLLIYKIEANKLLLVLQRTGSHSELFN